MSIEDWFSREVQELEPISYCTGEWPEHLFRAWANSDGSYISIDPYKIEKRTPKGAWLDDGGRRRFVNLQARKQWASETQEEALRQLYWRRIYWRDILHRQRKACDATIDILAKKGIK